MEMNIVKNEEDTLLKQVSFWIQRDAVSFGSEISHLSFFKARNEFQEDQRTASIEPTMRDEQRDPSWIKQEPAIPELIGNNKDREFLRELLQNYSYIVEEVTKYSNASLLMLKNCIQKLQSKNRGDVKFQEIMDELPYWWNIAFLRRGLQSLIEHGEIYTTYDDDHFRIV
jgi:hypothetical protein